MSITAARSGGRVVLEKSRSLQFREAIQQRDRDMYREHLEGNTYQDIARKHGRTKGLVSQRIAMLPAYLKREIRDDVASHRKDRLRRMSERLESASA